MGLLYKIAEERAQEYLDLPEELPARPAGSVGTPIVGGRLSGYEHNHEWKTPRSRARLISKMLRTSPVISMGIETLISRVTGVELTIHRREGVSEEACIALEKWLGIGSQRDGGGRLGNNQTTDDLIRHLMSAQVYGHVAMSESWTYDEGEGLYFCEFHRRRQESYSSYVTEAGTDRLLGIVQNTGFGARQVVLPMGETTWLVANEAEGWYDGVSILRSCFAHWRSEMLAYRLLDLTCNKWADPPQQGKLLIKQFVESSGTGGQPPTREDFQAEIQDMATKLSNLHADSEGNSHLLHPDYWEFTPRVQQASYSPAPLIDTINHMQRACAERLAISYLLQGRPGDGGSRSMVETQSRIGETATIDTLQWLLNGLNSQAVRRFMKVNFASLDPSEMPIVSFERNSVRTPFWMTNPGAFADFVSGAIITPTPSDERAIRASAGLPPPEEDAPSTLDRQAERAGGRLKTPGGQRESERPGDSKKSKNRFVNRLVEREEE